MLHWHDINIDCNVCLCRWYNDQKHYLVLLNMLMLQLDIHAQLNEFLNPAYLNSALQKALSSSVHSSDPCTQNVGFVLRQMTKPLTKNGIMHLQCYAPSLLSVCALLCPVSVWMWLAYVDCSAVRIGPLFPGWRSLKVTKNIINFYRATQLY